MKPQILELIDFKKVDALLEGFNKSTGFVTAILDLEGNVLSKSGWRQVCTHFHRVNPETRRNCTISDTVLAGKMAEGEKYHFYQCLNGMVDVAVPLVIDGEHVANLFSGQFFFEEPDRAFFKTQAGQYGFDEDKYLSALDSVPVVSKEKVKTAMDFLLTMTQLISEITLQKLVQMKLNESVLKSEERFRTFMDEAPVYAYIKDDSLNHIFSNKKVAALIETNRIGQASESARAIFAPEIADFLENSDKDILSGQANRRELEYKFNIGGDERWLDDIKFGLTLADGTRAVGGLALDITERKQAARRLAESEARFEAAMQASQDGLWEWNILTGEEYFSPRWYDILGYSREDQALPAPTFKTWEERIHPDDHARVMSALVSHLEKRTPYSVEYRHRHRSGEYRWQHARGLAIVDESGKPTKMVGTVSDITERKRSEALLTEQLDELRRWQQAMFGREDRILAMKKEVNDLLAEHGQPPRYASAVAGENDT